MKKEARKNKQYSLICQNSVPINSMTSSAPSKCHHRTSGLDRLQVKSVKIFQLDKEQQKTSNIRRFVKIAFQFIC
jgi:hypothetical protein